MNQAVFGLYLVILLLPPCFVFAESAAEPKLIVGTLKCKLFPHSGVNLLIHSSQDVRCKFITRDGSLVESYKGEIGIRFGIDISFSQRAVMLYSVLVKDVNITPQQLAGKYFGVSGHAILGFAAGDSSPIEKINKTVLLQPVRASVSGVGAAAGLSYLYLEVDKQ
ncbi:MAG: DUF992 domain-containing protein [Mariprofundaceae bacterium]